LQKLAQVFPSKLETKDGEILAGTVLVAGLIRAANYYFYSLPNLWLVQYCDHIGAPYWEMITVTDSWNLVYIFALSTKVSIAQFGKIVSAVKQPLDDYFLMVV
jgi:hypothetical protein